MHDDVSPIPYTENGVHGNICSLTGCQTAQIQLAEHLVQAPNDRLMNFYHERHARYTRSLRVRRLGHLSRF